MQTGCLPDLPARRSEDLASRPFRFAVAAPETAEQLIPWLRDQAQRPSCVGHAYAAGVDGVIAAVRGVPTSARRTPPDGVWASAISIWRDAHRLQGRLESLLTGTRLQYAVDSLRRRGWDPYKAGEEADDHEAGAPDDIFDEMFAHDQKAPGAKHFRFPEATLASAVASALSDPTLAVVGAWDLKAGFFKLKKPEGASEALVTTRLVGDGPSHALRIVACRIVQGQRQFLVQNSWPQWGGARTPSGIWMPQCAWMTVAALMAATDIVAVRPKVAL